jgi:hypothetical protein
LVPLAAAFALCAQAPAPRTFLAADMELKAGALLARWQVSALSAYICG